MKISELIEQLQEIQDQCGPDQIVHAYCPEGEAPYPVTGMTYGGGENIVELFTDSDEGASE
jgi:hypothetical protein